MTNKKNVKNCAECAKKGTCKAPFFHNYLYMAKAAEVCDPVPRKEETTK